MKLTRSSLLISCFALVLSVTNGIAADVKDISRKVVAPEQAHENSEKLLTEIDWHKSLNEAKAVAQREGKLVFWMHMLGDLGGFT